MEIGKELAICHAPDPCECRCSVLYSIIINFIYTLASEQNKPLEVGRWWICGFLHFASLELMGQVGAPIKSPCDMHLLFAPICPASLLKSLRRQGYQRQKITRRSSCPHEELGYCEPGTEPEWALSVFFTFFNIKEWFFAFLIKLIWLRVFFK